MVAGNNHIDKEDFLYLYPPAREAVFLARNIRNGFAGAGLKPLDQDWVLEKFVHQHHHYLLKAQYHLLLKHLKILARLITRFKAYREVFKRNEHFLAV